MANRKSRGGTYKIYATLTPTYELRMLQEPKCMTQERRSF